MVRLHVKTLDGTVDLPVEVYLTAKVEEVMNIIKKQRQIELIDQKLIFINTILEPHHTLLDYRIQGEDVLHLVLGANVVISDTGIIVEKNRLLGSKISGHNVGFRMQTMKERLGDVSTVITVRDRIGLVAGSRLSGTSTSPSSSPVASAPAAAAAKSTANETAAGTADNSPSKELNLSPDNKKNTTVDNKDDDNKNDAATSNNSTSSPPAADKPSAETPHQKQQQPPQKETSKPFTDKPFVAERLLLPPVVAAGRPVPFVNFFVAIHVRGTKLRCKFYPRVDDSPSLNILQHLCDHILMHFGLTKRHFVSRLEVELDDDAKTRKPIERDEDFLEYPNATRTLHAEINLIRKFDGKNPILSVDSTRSLGRGTMTESFSCSLSHTVPLSSQQQQSASVSQNHLGGASPSPSYLPSREHPHSGPSPRGSSVSMLGNSSPSSVSPTRGNYATTVEQFQQQQQYQQQRQPSPNRNNNNSNTATTTTAATASSSSYFGANVKTPFDPTRYIAKRLFCFDPHDAGYLLDEKKKIAEAHESSLQKLNELQPHPNLLLPIGRVCQEVKQRYRGVERSIGEVTVYLIYPRYEQSLWGFMSRIGNDPFAPMALTIVRKLIYAIRHLHKFNTVHGSITTKNVLFQFLSPNADSVISLSAIQQLNQGLLSVLGNSTAVCSSHHQENGNTNNIINNDYSSYPSMSTSSPTRNHEESFSHQQYRLNTSSPTNTNGNPNTLKLINELKSSSATRMNCLPPLHDLDVRLTDWYQPELLAQHGTGYSETNNNSNNSNETPNEKNPAAASSSSETTSAPLIVENEDSKDKRILNTIKQNSVAPELRQILDPADRTPTKQTDLWQLGVICLQLFDALELGQYQCMKLQTFVEKAEDYVYVKNESNSSSGRDNKKQQLSNNKKNLLPEYNGLMEMKSEQEDNDDIAVADEEHFQFRDERESFKHEVSYMLLNLAEGLLCFEPSKRAIRVI